MNNYAYICFIFAIYADNYVRWIKALKTLNRKTPSTWNKLIIGTYFLFKVNLNNVLTINHKIIISWNKISWYVYIMLCFDSRYYCIDNIVTIWADFQQCMESVSSHKMNTVTEITASFYAATTIIIIMWVCNLKLTLWFHTLLIVTILSL